MSVLPRAMTWNWFQSLTLMIGLELVGCLLEGADDAPRCPVAELAARRRAA